METLVATVLIVIIFMISSMLMNSMFSHSVKGRGHYITERLQQLKYEYSHDGFELPYYEDREDWELSVSTETKGETVYAVFKAESKKSRKTYTERVIDEKQVK